MKTYRMACIGMGRYAGNYVRALTDLSRRGRVQVVAIADPRPPADAEASLAALAHDGTRLYADYEEMLRDHPTLDAVTIGTPVYLHEEMVVRAVESGCHVLCAKPAATTVQAVDRMIEAAGRTGRTVMIDFQHVYSATTQRVKEAVAGGEIGAVRTVRVTCLWQRPDTYYQRNPGAGRIRLNGAYVLDGPMNNPHSHYIMNALYFAHPDRYGFARPATVEAELYRCRETIECEDTACVRCMTDTGVTVLLYSSLCSRDSTPRTEIEVRGEKGRAILRIEDCRIEPADGPAVELPAPRARSAMVADRLIEVLDGQGRSLVGLEDARNHVLFTGGAYESARTVHPLGEPFAHAETQDGGRIRYIEGLRETVEAAAGNAALFSEQGVAWARPAGRPFPLEGYKRFSRFA